MSDERIEWMAEYAVSVVFSQPWFAYRIVVSNQNADALLEIIEKHGLSYYRYRRTSVDVAIVMSASIKIKQEYVRRCCTKYLVDDISEIIGEYLGHKK